MYTRLAHISETRRETVGGGTESRADRSAGRRTARRGLVGSSPQPLSPKGDPPKRPTTNQKSQHTIPSLRFQNPLRGRRVFLPVSQGGLPGGRGAQAPGAAQPPELQEVGRTSVTALQGSDAGVPGPRSGVEINTAPAARRRCRRCPAGPRGQPCCSASCRPLPTHGRSPQRAVREEQRPLFCHGQHQARPQVPWAARVPSRSLPATGSREEISRGSAGHI